jgi:hypothetical protein
MDREEADLTPAEEWQQSLNSTCNRLSTQYLNLLRAASSVSALEKGHQDPRGKKTVPTFAVGTILHQATKNWALVLTYLDFYIIFQPEADTCSLHKILPPHPWPPMSP